MSSITEVPQQYRTSDGREFANKAEAERHQKLVDAIEAFDKAHDALGFTLAQSQWTADGKPFEFGRTH